MLKETNAILIQLYNRGLSFINIYITIFPTSYMIRLGQYWNVLPGLLVRFHMRTCQWAFSTSHPAPTVAVRSSHLGHGALGLHVEFLEQVVLAPPDPQSFTIDINRQTSNADGNCGDGEDIHHLSRPVRSNPVVGEVGQTEEQEVLHKIAD